MGHVEMSKLAKARTDVVVTRGGNQRQGKLLYWSSKRGRAKVLLPSGSVITVATDSVALLNGENIVVDEIDVDAQYRNFRGVRPPGSAETRTGDRMPPVRDAAAQPQPRMGCVEDEPDHVA